MLLRSSLQDSIVAIDSQAIDAQPVASRRGVRKLENCRTYVSKWYIAISSTSYAPVAVWGCGLRQCFEANKRGNRGNI
jgi:hypothetical protein